jgi:uncharacterized CHY-type Zn-finger protein
MDDVKVFIKCAYCHHTVYTETFSIFTVLAKREHNIVCKECEQPLKQAYIFLCAADHSEFCDGCEFRFHCYSQLPLGLDKKFLP